MEYVRLGQIDLKAHIGDRVYATFLARDVTIRLQKDQVTKYIVFNMVDKDTSVEARIFGATDKVIESVQEGKVYRGAIDVKPYDKSSSGYSCIMYNMSVSDIPPQYFADWAENIDDSRKVIQDTLGECYETCYGQIAYPIIVKCWTQFSQWTAASGQHHTQLGGLLTHTAEVISIASGIADYFIDKYGESFINKPLLLCAAALHDVGKIYELQVDILSGKTEYSTHSIMSTHIMDVLKEVDIKAYELGFGQPEIVDSDGNITGTKSQETIEDEKEAVELLRHCLAAHHGKLEYGSPITAATPEAVILSVADQLSADMYKYNRAFKNLEPGTFVSNWSNGGYIKYYKDSSKMGELDEIEGN